MQSPIPPAHLSFHNLAQPTGSPQPPPPPPPPPAAAALPPPPDAPSSQLVVEPSAGSEPEPPTPKRFVPTGEGHPPGGAYVGDTGAKPNVYTAVYSSIPVFECMVRGIAVMRRRSDAWMNATQILKVAGIEKGKRTKILEKDIIPGPGPYEKVQGGYGKYQGTWLPLDRSLDLATLYGVNNLLSVLFDHNLSDAATVAALPTAGRQATPSKPRNPTAGRLGGPPQARQLTLPSHPPTSGLPSNPNMASPFQPVPNIYHHPIQPAAHGGQVYGGPQSSQAQMMVTSSSYPQHFAPQQYQPPQALSSKRPRQDDGDEEARRMDQLAEEHRRVAAGVVSVPGGGYQGGLEPYGGDSSMGPPSSKKMRPSDGPPYQGAAFQNSPRLQESTPTRTLPVSSGPSAVASASRQPIASGSALPPPPPVAGPSSAAPAPNGTSSRTLSDTSSFPPTSSVVPFTRFASKPSDPANNPDPSRQRALLLGFFDHTSSSDPTGSDDPADPTVLLPDPSDTFDPNLVIDSYGHTALHWACSLSRPNLVSFLLARGADPHRGNYAGETPLIRSVLATNHYDTQSFAAVLSTHNDELSSTLRTLDTSHRTVLHHIALVAGMKGRAASARYYLEAVLEWIARNEGLGGGTTGSGKGFRTIVDIVDCNGDTALNIAARVGNRSLVGLFLSVQADKTIPNKMGLRAGDYGCEEEALKISPAEEAVAAIRDPPPGPIQKSKDVIADLTKTIESLSESFLSEIKVKQDVLTVTESHLRGATKTLSSERRRIKSLRSKLTELDALNIRIKNVQAALVEEEMFDWSGRYNADGAPILPNTPGSSSSFVFREDVPSSAVVEGGEVDPVPRLRVRGGGKGGLMEEVVELRRIGVWQERVEGLLEERIRMAEVKRREKEVMFRKIIAICSNVPLELIGSMLDTLITAVESDGEGLDVGRVTGFMNKVRQQQQQSSQR